MKFEGATKKNPTIRTYVYTHKFNFYMTSLLHCKLNYRSEKTT